MHFITNCKINQFEQDTLYCNMMQVDQSFMNLHGLDKFTLFQVEIHLAW